MGVPAGDGNAGFFRIGKVMSADPHPDADRLNVCAVQLAGSDMRTIVCGAPNVAAGETVAGRAARAPSAGRHQARPRQAPRRSSRTA